MNGTRRLRDLPEETLSALHAGRGRSWFGGNRAHVVQQVLRPGDRLEVLARISTTVSPAGEAVSGRGTPLLLMAEPLEDGADAGAIVARVGART